MQLYPTKCSITGCAVAQPVMLHFVGYMLHFVNGVRDFLTFFRSRLWGSDPSTDIHAKWLKQRVFTQGCAFCSKIRYFSYPLISRSPKRSNFANFWTFFARFWPLTLEVTERTPLILHQSSMKVA